LKEQEEAVLIYDYDFYLVDILNDKDASGFCAWFKIHLPQDGVQEFIAPLTQLLARDEARKILAAKGIVRNGKRLDNVIDYIMAVIENQQRQKASKDKKLAKTKPSKTSPIDRMDDDMETTITWNDSLETLVAEEAERCGGLSWLHIECEKYFSIHTNCIALPVIILSTVNGFLSGSSQTIFTNVQVSSIALGIVSLFTGVLSTLGSYFSWAKRTEAHRISAIQYQKISKFLTIELTLPKGERVAAKDILKITREQIERLMEISPAIPENILKKYRDRFKDITDVAHPEVIQGLKKVVINKFEPSEDDGAIRVNYTLPNAVPTALTVARR
jgi:hypothetical protein